MYNIIITLLIMTGIPFYSNINAFDLPESTIQDLSTEVTKEEKPTEEKTYTPVDPAELKKQFTVVLDKSADISSLFDNAQQKIDTEFQKQFEAITQYIDIADQKTFTDLYLAFLKNADEKINTFQKEAGEIIQSTADTLKGTNIAGIITDQATAEKIKEITNDLINEFQNKLLIYRDKLYVILKSLKDAIIQNTHLQELAQQELAENIEAKRVSENKPIAEQHNLGFSFKQAASDFWQGFSKQGKAEIDKVYQKTKTDVTNAFTRKAGDIFNDAIKQAEQSIIAKVSGK